tara:strand:+ start:46 stop:420 length:375 start_codon:yes stop_codon:yes gene_type:complete
MTEEIKEFCHKYNAEVCESRRIHRRPGRVLFAQVFDNYDSFEPLPYEDVKCVEVHLPEDRFRALMEHDEWLQRARDNRYSKADEGICIVKQHERESRIRHENPAVGMAYQKYKAMLDLVTSYYD